MWCSKMTDKYATNVVLGDTHLPGQFRSVLKQFRISKLQRLIMLYLILECLAPLQTSLNSIEYLVVNQVKAIAELTNALSGDFLYIFTFLNVIVLRLFFAIIYFKKIVEHRVKMRVRVEKFLYQHRCLLYLRMSLKKAAKYRIRGKRHKWCGTSNRFRCGYLRLVASSLIYLYTTLDLDNEKGGSSHHRDR